jgi:MFS family permease
MSPLHFIRDNARFLAAGMVLTFSSAYGQTFFISIFAAELMDAYGLTDGQWGLTYTIATVASALAMFWAGASTDHYRVRVLAWIVMPGLALGCIAMALNTWVFGLVLVVFVLRLLGQGMMSQLAVTAMARWFVARRGLALSISAMGFALGQSVFPVIFALLLGAYHWRTLWFLAAALVLLTFPLVLWLLKAERTPQSHADQATSVGMDGRHWTRPEVMKSPFFWLVMPMLLGPPSWGTALFFQQVHIAEVKGFDLVEYLSLIPLLTAVSVVTSLASGQLIDRFGTARLFQFYPIPFVLAFAVIGTATTLPVTAIGLLFFGLGSGIQATIPAAFWAEFFGTRHIGAIKAVSTSVMVFGSAIGPGISGALIDLGHDFPSQMMAITAYFGFAMVLVWIAVEVAKKRLPAAAQIDIERP